MAWLEITIDTASDKIQSAVTTLTAGFLGLPGIGFLSLLAVM